MEDALEVLQGFIHDGNPHHIITADASMLVMAQSDTALFEIITKAEMVTPDSIGVLWASKRLGKPIKERVSGVVIGERLCALSAQKGYRIFFVGAAPGVAQQAAAKMQEKYPGCQIVGFRDGYFKPEEEENILNEISHTKPDILLVAMGIPKQEKWITKHRARLGIPVMIGVGGTLDVLSGQVKRAPILMQKLSLEWLWRVLSNPKKINKVMLLPKFVQLVLRKQV